MRNQARSIIRKRIRPIALSIVAPVAGFLLILLFEILFRVELPKLLSSLINLVVVAVIAFYIFPRLLGIPFGQIELSKFLTRLGFYLPPGAWKHILLGLLLADGRHWLCYHQAGCWQTRSTRPSRIVHF